MIIEYSIEDIEGVAATILQAVTTPIIRLDGAMGAGKTTVIRALCNQLGVSESISSPTFSLVNAYTGSSGLMYHFDFYRLENPDEALDFGVEEYFDSGKIWGCKFFKKVVAVLRTWTGFRVVLYRIDRTILEADTAIRPVK